MQAPPSAVSLPWGSTLMILRGDSPNLLLSLLSQELAVFSTAIFRCWSRRADPFSLSVDPAPIIRRFLSRCPLTGISQNLGSPGKPGAPVRHRHHIVSRFPSQQQASCLSYTSSTSDTLLPDLSPSSSTAKACQSRSDSRLVSCGRSL
ncbi:uncharacterized protein EI97DRAFT_159585 [Westerdykella ornata]|uniref:Uncharacterized protein n=1 Tax=Westerdykella ornata TaxID=318751 RepID=A0A6A6JA40_WESOR|nr:uncharacterized protein EI97DRAFT_159585 [Westerdykella ornata]KAF2273262.1 hypothetical protein EI97DRAFT_159585 [Westerdykella ornata]